MVRIQTPARFKSLCANKENNNNNKNTEVKKTHEGLTPLPPQLLFYLLARERVALARATMMRADKDDSKVRVALARVMSDDDYDDDDDKGKGNNNGKGNDDGKGGKY